MLLSDRGLEDETPESDAHDLTDADRTIFGAVSSGDGDVDEVMGFVVRDGHEDAVANEYAVDVTTDVACAGETVDVGGDARLLRAGIGYERQRGGEQLFGITTG